MKWILGENEFELQVDWFAFSLFRDYGIKVECVVPENIHTSPMEGIFFKTSPPLWKYQLSFIHLSKFFGLAEPPLPRKFQSLPRGEHGHFLELPNKSLPNRLTNIHQSRSILPECYIHVLSQDKHFWNPYEKCFWETLKEFWLTDIS